MEQIAVTEPWASVDEVAKHLGVAKDSVYRWIGRRGLPTHKIGRLCKLKLTEVDDWVRRRDDGIDDGGLAPAVDERPASIPERRGRT